MTIGTGRVKKLAVFSLMITFSYSRKHLLVDFFVFHFKMLFPC